MNNVFKTRVATRLAFHWYGNYRKIEAAHHEKMSETVEANPDSIRTSKALYNPKIAALKNINALKTTIREYWESVTTPYPEPGIRLMLKSDIDSFNAKMTTFTDDLWHAAYEVQAHRDDIIDDAKVRLGKLYNGGNYPADMTSLFAFEVSYPSLEPPSDLPSNVYEQQKQMAEAKLQEAIAMAEAAFLEEFQKMVANLKDKLTPGPEGEKKIFHATALTNLIEFFDRFKKLNISDNAEFEAIVSQAKALVSGLSPDELRKLPALRVSLAKELGDINTALTPLVVNAPRRKIIKPKEAPCHSQAQGSESPDAQFATAQ